MRRCNDGKRGGGVVRNLRGLGVAKEDLYAGLEALTDDDGDGAPTDKPFDRCDGVEAWRRLDVGERICQSVGLAGAVGDLYRDTSGRATWHDDGEAPGFGIKVNKLLGTGVTLSAMRTCIGSVKFSPAITTS